MLTTHTPGKSISLLMQFCIPTSYGERDFAFPVLQLYVDFVKKTLLSSYHYSHLSSLFIWDKFLSNLFYIIGFHNTFLMLLVQVILD